MSPMRLRVTLPANDNDWRPPLPPALSINARSVAPRRDRALNANADPPHASAPSTERAPR